MKKLILLIFISTIITLKPIFAKQNLSIVINGEIQDANGYHIKFDEKNHILFPVRWLAEKLNYTICWDNVTKTTTLYNINSNICFKENDRYMYIDDKKIDMKIPAKIIDERLFIPIINVDENIIKTRWNDNTNTLYIMDINRILYENEELGIGFVTPNGYTNNCYKVLENVVNDKNIVINFFDLENEEVLIFSLSYFDLEYWNNEVKDTFPIPYSEIFRNNIGILLCVNTSDIQYNINDIEQKKNYLTLLNLKEKVCNNLYMFTD